MKKSKTDCQPIGNNPNFMNSDILCENLDNPAINKVYCFKWKSYIQGVKLLVGKSSSLKCNKRDA